MERMKRVVSLMLCIVMVFGLLPMTVFAADNAPIDAAVFGSDVHGGTSTVESVMKGIYNADNAFNPTTVSFVGDTQIAASQVTAKVNNVFPNAQTIFSYGNHDSEGNYGIEKYTGLSYSGNYYIYSISESDMGSNPDTSDFVAQVEKMDKTKPLFILSHKPLHDRRNDNAGAAAWYEVITDAAAEMDIAFFWGHNHTSESSSDLNAYYVPNDGSEKMTIEGKSGSVGLNFTYLNAGYIDPTNNPSRTKVATAVRIYEDSINYTVYNANGELTGTYALNVDVERKFAAAADEEIVTEAPTEAPTEAVTEKVTAPVDRIPMTSTGPSSVALSSIEESVTVGGITEVEKTKTVYVLQSGNPSGEVLIANKNSATSSNGTNLVANKSNSLANVTADVIYGDCDGDGDKEYYIELSDTDAGYALWTVGGSYTFANNGRYLRQNSGSLSVSTSSTTWSYGSNRLSNGNYYLRYNNGWTATRYSSYATNVYFYAPQTVAYKETVDSSVTYTINAQDISYVYPADAAAYTAQINASVTEGAPAGTYNYYIVGENNILNAAENGQVVFNGNAGTAQVMVTYTFEVDGTTYTIGKTINVTAVKPGYALEITRDDVVVSGSVISMKGVKDGTTLDLGTKIYQVTADSTTESTLPNGMSIVWEIPDEYQTIATVENGQVTFKGVDGIFYVTAKLMNGSEIVDSKNVTISATTTSYSIPSDGATDFPEYPNEGAIRYDKTAVAVGNFSSTGIAKMELSMTGVPYTTGSEIDVVLVLDMSTSMDDVIGKDSNGKNIDRRDVTVAAAKAFVEKIVKNTDGSINGNRIAVYFFRGAAYHDVITNRGLSAVTDMDNDGDVDQADLDKLLTEIGKISYNGTQGTCYNHGLKGAYDTLKAARQAQGYERQQFCVFMSDGVPTQYQYGSSSSETYTNTSNMQGMFTGTNYDTRSSTKYKYEYYSTEMKKEGVNIYSVGVGLNNANSAWNGKSATQCLNASSILLNDISGPAKEETPDTGTALSKKDKYFFSVSDTEAAANLNTVFSGIAKSILQAATNVTVEDQITGDYTMIFDVPTGKNTISVNGQEFYIEFLKYTLDENNERTSTSTSMTKLYLGQKDGKYYAASNATGTAYAAPVFEQKPVGDKGSLYYWTTNAALGDTGVSVEVNGTTYYFVSYGLESGYNMTSGAYAAGTVNDNNTSTDLIIAAPYFVYNANTKMLYWTVDKLDSYEYVLNYFLYLDNSATQVGEPNEKPAGTYPTNDHAYITYTNFLDHDCRQEFPKPQMTWNGAQASYVFYLVNAQGEPINKSGQKVDFANATFVTDVYTESVIWNKVDDAGQAQLDVNWLAQEKLPTDYKIYDERAQYILSVYENADGTTLKDQFTIAGGTAAQISGSLNSRLNLTTTAQTVSTDTTKVYNTKAGTKYTEYGTYTSTDKDMAGFDFANTTVAFAVVWQPKLVEDAVVVDFGLDVLIDVVQNDLLQNTLDGIGLSNGAYGTTAMNTGVAGTSKFGKSDLTIDGNTIHVENEKQVRFSQGDMEFKTPVTFYYESAVNFTEHSQSKTGYMYSSVTVIPATTIYYEDDFVTLNSYTRGDRTQSWTEAEVNAVWTQVGKTIDATQAQDRPGASQITGSLDADNIYGYDQAYDKCAEYSMGSAKKATVSATQYGTATFTFWGTGFDVVSLTDSNTGTILVDVVNASGEQVKNYAVDTYYGYKHVMCDVIYTYDERANNGNGAWIQTAVYENSDDYSKSNPAEKPEHGDTYVVERMDYVVDPKAADTLYQVPVIKSANLPYGKYTVTIKAIYDPGFDHKDPGYDEGEYEFILDAIRIYNPTGNLNDTANDAYEQDGETLVAYEEIRDLLIEADTFDGYVTDTSGAMFIDGQSGKVSMEDYKNYGPNNEVYLDNGQSISFRISGAADLNQVHIGAKSANGGEVTYSIMNVVDGAVVNKKTFTLATSTDMYYDLTEWKDGAIVITNESDAILSLTNLKYTSNVEVDAYAYVTAEDAAMVLRALRVPGEEEAEPETEPETEPVPTVQSPSTGSSTGQTVVKKIIGMIGKLLGKIFG